MVQTNASVFEPATRRGDPRLVALHTPRDRHKRFRFIQGLARCLNGALPHRGTCQRLSCKCKPLQRRKTGRNRNFLFDTPSAAQFLVRVDDDGKPAVRERSTASDRPGVCVLVDRSATRIEMVVRQRLQQRACSGIARHLERGTEAALEYVVGEVAVIGSLATDAQAVCHLERESGGGDNGSRGTGSKNERRADALFKNCAVE